MNSTRTILAVLAALMLSGCETMGEAINNMSDNQKTAVKVAAGLIVVGLVVNELDGDDTFITNNCHGHGNQTPCD